MTSKASCPDGRLAPPAAERYAAGAPMAAKQDFCSDPEWKGIGTGVSHGLQNR